MLQGILIGILCNIVAALLIWLAKKAFQLISAIVQQCAHYRKRKH